MAIILDDILIELTDALGTAEQNLYTYDRRVRAINSTIQQLLTFYDIDQYRVTVNLNFNNGVAVVPDDMLRAIQIRNAAQNTSYLQVDFLQFQEQVPNTWIFQYNTVTDAQDIHVKPALTGQLEFSYTQMPAALVDGSDSLRLRDWWLQAIAYQAAAYLFKQTSNFNRAESAEKTANDFKAMAWQSERQKIVGKEEQRLRSVYETKPFLTRSNYAWAYYFNSTCMNWTTINSDTIATVNYGYFVNGGSLVTLTLPLQANVGDIIEIAGQGVGGWRVAQNDGQQIIFGITQTTVGTGGYIENTQQNDTVRLVCQVTNNRWEVVNGVIGNITVV